MTGFALYRLPHQEQVTLVAQTAGEPMELPSFEALNGQSGFVVAPFSISSKCPLILIRPDVVTVSGLYTLCIPAVYNLYSGRIQSVYSRNTSCIQPEYNRYTYSDDFQRFFAALEDGRFRKLVLSRCAEQPIEKEMLTCSCAEQPIEKEMLTCSCAEQPIEKEVLTGRSAEQPVENEAPSPLSLFQKACRMYPRLFVSLVYTPQSGLWLTATPEILLEGDGRQWRTIALAGTMKLKDDELRGEGESLTWSTKNIQEQRYVATYLKDCLEPFASDIREEGPRTVRAANLVHLRSDFTFTLFNYARVGTLLQALHPTPAVCGLPKDDAFRFILDNEHTPRQYYSGFMGPLNLPPSTHVLPSTSTHVLPSTSTHVLPPTSTHLYVSLRCMQITSTHYRMYAGGGLLKDSIEEQEWQETEAKLETMRHLL